MFRNTILLIVCMIASACAASRGFKELKTTGSFFSKKYCNEKIVLKELTITPQIRRKINGKSSGPWSVIKGQDATLNLKFETKTLGGLSTEKLKFSLCGVVLFTCLPMPLPDYNACNGKGLECPLNDNSKYTFNLKLPISPMYPTMSVGANLFIKNENEDCLVGIKIPLQIKNKN